MARALTTKAVEAAKPSGNRQEIPDGIVSGLYLVVQPSGGKSWALRYRHAGKPCKLTLGRFPIMQLKDARDAATDALEVVERGENPAVEKKATKAAKLQAAIEGRDKIKNLLDEYEKRHLAKIKSGSQARGFLDRFILDPWGERDVQSIKKRDIIDLLDEIADSGRETTANRTLAYLRKFLNWCVERDILEISPATGVKPPAKENKRERVLSDAEIRLFWQACADAGQPFGPLGKLLLLTGQRRGEVGEMTEAEISGDTWNLSRERTKNGRAHVVPLSKAARAVLGGVERVRGKAGYLFTTTGTTPVSGFSKAHSIISAKMAKLAGKEAGEPVEIAQFTWHDLRRTCATGMQRLGFPEGVIEAALNHISGTKAGIVGVYQRHDYADEKREALEAWGQAVADIVAGLDPVAEVRRRDAEARAQEAAIEAAANVVKLEARA
jgi:integrase